MENVVFGWQITNLCGYLLAVFFGALGVRVFLAVLRSVELAYAKEKPRNFWEALGSSIRGIHGDKAKANDNDYWLPFILGVLELGVFPILLSTGALAAVGAWIGFKTVALWKTWLEERPVFNRFLIGNAIIVVLAALIARSGFLKVTMC